MKRVAAAWGAVAAAALATAAHVGYWYVPRERGGTPTAPEVRALLAEPGWDAAVWIPYPHQNLAVLESRVGDFRSWLELFAGTRAARTRTLPSFGPFAVPPAYELAAAWRRSDGSSAAALRVYPLVGFLARLSGRLAGNPWLAGGDVPLGRGRAGQVSWRHGIWCLEVSGGGPAAPPFEPSAGEAAPLALVRLGSPFDRLPAGLYRLVRASQGLELRLGATGPEAGPPRLAGPDVPAAWRLESAADGALSALLLWDRDGPVPPLPAAASIRRGDAKRPRLPGEELVRLTGDKPRERQQDGFELRALDARELDAAARLLPEVASRVAEEPRLRLWAGADPERLGTVARHVADRFRGLPIGALLGFEPAALAERLGALEGCGVSVLEVDDDPPAVRWWVCPPRPQTAPAR